jgi:hypothetical protein
MAAFEFPIDKLGVINSGLSQTGDNLVNVAEDGSPEWNVCSPAYERALGYMMEQHGWTTATDVRTLQPTGTAPTDDLYDTAYAFPRDMVHLIWVRVSDRPVNYDILAGQLILNARGGNPQPNPPNTPQPVTIKAVFSTNSDVVNQTPTFVLSMVGFVMSGIYRGLHKDVGQAERMWNGAKMLAQEAMTRHDQQKPKRAMFNSRLSASRRVRRPWPLIPPDFGGTGRPG